MEEMRVRACSLSPERNARLRRAGRHRAPLIAESNYDRRVWQFPVILIPLGTEEAPDSIVPASGGLGGTA